MTLRSQFCNSNEGNSKETMLFLVLEDNDKEVLRVPLYLSSEARSEIPSLEPSLKKLPSLLKMIYNSGKNQEKIEFVEETIQI